MTMGEIEWSLRGQFGWIDFKKPKAAVGYVFRLVKAIAQLHAADQKISAGHKGEVSP